MSNIITFAHLADLHLGAWREKKLTDLNFITFQKAIDKVIESRVDFCLFAGDIFNNAMPPIDLVTKVVIELNRLKDYNIPLYVIGGSHDYSNSGKSFINLLDKSGVFEDVCKFEYLSQNKVDLVFTKNEDLKLNISGILGRKKGLDKNYYNNLNKNNLSSNTFNVFMFHCTLDDIKPDFMKAVKSEITSDFLPKGFDYYAGGHVHTYIESNYDSGLLSYPGPLFPNNFSELKREKPAFNLCEFDFDTRKVKITRQFIQTYEIEYVNIELDNINAIQARTIIEERLDDIDYKDKILLIEIKGIIEGKINDININRIISKCYENGALHVLKNTYKLTSSELKDYEVIQSTDIDLIQKEIIDKYLEGSESKEKELDLINSILKLDLQKNDEEKISQYESRIVDTLDKSLNIK